MAAEKAASPSSFVWYELHTPDAAQADKFYRPVLGWNTKDAGMKDKKYTMLHAGEIPIGGFLEKPAQSFADGMKPSWMGYIGVSDVDSWCERLERAGGKIHRPSEDIPGVGRFAVVADPQGAIFVLFQPGDPSQTAMLPAPGTPGAVSWHDLGARDWQSAFAFYSDLFGWEKANAIDMGPAGVYQIFSLKGAPIGGMMTLENPKSAPGWLFYFNVDEIGAAVSRVKEQGGSITHGPSEVPGGLHIAHCLDTQGAAFGIVGRKG
jgi:uncharacterized protein